MPASLEADSDTSARGVGLLAAIRRFPLIVVAAVVIAALLGALVSLLIPAKYTATAQIVLGNPNESTVFRTVPILNATAAAQDATQIMRSEAVYERASALLDHKLSSSGVAKAVSVTPGAQDAPMVTITATRGSASKARDLANAEGQAYLDVTKSQTSARAARARAALLEPQKTMKSELASLNTQLKMRAAQLSKGANSIVKPSDKARYVESALSSDPRYQSLQSQASALITSISTIGQTIQETAVDASLSESGVDTLYGASLPNNPRGSNLKRNIVIAAVLGLLIGAALAWRRLDHERGPDSGRIAALLEAPLLGMVTASPELSVPTQTVDLTSGSPLSDNVRVLASTLILGLRRKGLRSCVITSLEPGAGKTVFALNIAAAADFAGYDVVLVDGDIRNPTLASQGSSISYAPGRELGLTTLGTQDASADSVAIIDSPPFFADPLPLVLASDGAALVVIVTKDADPDDLRALRARAESAGATILGFLINEHATRDVGRHHRDTPRARIDNQQPRPGPDPSLDGSFR